eukprot:CAMPEP_0197688914 /NCGR_PEP_ID=MMETSP1338-20131121/106129_1 /TAXON_ID=43686 ORGANISM="Pelagodinium beii, Strain RCC1491" /NCGR_SAMPLE_ID=MMETSP1338 /ASSEMBLY_ACC=CAM_ASM_000754 /LENGTH=245 /DNA_ID=CAMNT_0043271195 /DNA_START=32 /DNA_END=766 /DNA_ORIENTATION=+
MYCLIFAAILPLMAGISDSALPCGHDEECCSQSDVLDDEADDLDMQLLQTKVELKTVDLLGKSADSSGLNEFLIATGVAKASNRTLELYRLHREMNESLGAAPTDGDLVKGNLSSSSAASNIKTLYHMTNKQAGPLILNSQFRAGHSGWCGGAIYFSPSPYDCWHKAAPDQRRPDGVFMIEAQVDLGRMKAMPWHCTSPSFCYLYNELICPLDKTNRGAEFSAEGYDSTTFNPGDGQEYIIWDGA